MQHFKVIDGFPEFDYIVGVPEDDFKVGRIGEKLAVDGVSTCLVVTLWDPTKKVRENSGALAHIQGLPDSPEKLKPHQVIDTLLEELHITGRTDLSHLESTLSGEGRVFIERFKKAPVVRDRLQAYGIRIIGEDLDIIRGGRLAFLDCGTGEVEVYRA